jgi:hypothetical protein
MTLSKRRIGWIVFKASLMAWALVMFLVPPIILNDQLDTLLLGLWTGLTFLGAGTSIVGLVMGGTRGAVVEMTGLPVMAVGPLVYFFAQFSLMTSQEDGVQNRLALLFFAFAMLAAVAARIVEVFPTYKKGN